MAIYLLWVGASDSSKSSREKRSREIYVGGRYLFVVMIIYFTCLRKNSVDQHVIRFLAEADLDQRSKNPATVSELYLVPDWISVRNHRRW
jgi:hypothetical protein